MAPVCRGALTTRIGDAKAIETTGLTGWSLVSSPSPSHGTFRVKGTGGSPPDRISIGNAGSDNWLWYIDRQARLDGTLSSGDVIDVLATGAADVQVLYLERIYVSSTTYNYRVRNSNAFGVRSTVVTGTTAFNTAQSYTMRFEINTSTRAVKLWINGTLELSGTAVSGTSLGGIFLACAGATSTKFNLYTLPCIWSSSSESDRPGVAPTDWMSKPDGNTSETDYGSHADCATVTNGDFGHWDEWTTDTTNAANDATDFNCGPAANKQEKSTLTAPTITTQDYWGAVGVYRQQANVGAKTVQSWSRWTYSGNTVEVQMSNVGLNAWKVFFAAHPVAPGGGALSQAMVDGSEFGHRVVSTNGANCEVTAMAVIWITIDADPPAVAADDRRRTLAGFV